MQSGKDRMKTRLGEPSVAETTLWIFDVLHCDARGQRQGLPEAIGPMGRHAAGRAAMPIHTYPVIVRRRQREQDLRLAHCRCIEGAWDPLSAERHEWEGSGEGGQGHGYRYFPGEPAGEVVHVAHSLAVPREVEVFVLE